MYDAAESKAKEVGADFNWKLVIVDDAGHVNAEMARVASLLVE
jgi:predicted alpha/beta hydrolase family esterase